MIVISDEEKAKWKDYQRELQTKVILKYVDDEYSNMVVPKTNLYPKTTLYPSRGQSIYKSIELNIISINLLEEIDVKTTSIPSNSISIKIDNSLGYFDEFSENSIINKLNNDTTIDFYIKISEFNYILLSHINYDNVKTNLDKTATITGYGIFNKLNKIPFRINDSSYVATLNNENTNNLSSYLNDSYNYIFDVPTSNDNILTSSLDLINGKYETLYDVMWQLQSNTKNGFWVNDRYNYIKLINRRNTIVETITKNMQIEKPKLTKEQELTCVVANNSISNINTLQETGEFKYEFEGVFTNNFGTLTRPLMNLLITSDDYDLSNLTSNDITTTNCTIYNMIKAKRYCFLMISGTDNTSIKIEISKILNKLEIDVKNIVIGKQQDNFISLNSLDNILNGTYYDDIINIYPINLHIETKIMGLPYLELGDVVSIQTDYGEKIVNITKISCDFDGGFTMNVEGYSTDYDGLFPSDDLFPLDTLYPNMRLED